VAVTRHGLYGGARQPYGDFTGKVAGAHPVANVTRHGLYGGARGLYGNFEDKGAANDEVTSSGQRRLDQYHLQRQRNEDQLRVHLRLRAVEQDEIIQIVNTIREILE
jgi:hypothetical protein